jgi:hypothetical protein
LYSQNVRLSVEVVSGGAPVQAVRGIGITGLRVFFNAMKCAAIAIKGLGVKETLTLINGPLAEGRDLHPIKERLTAQRAIQYRAKILHPFLELISKRKSQQLTPGVHRCP